MNKAFITHKPIGVIRSEHVIAQDTPIQPIYAKAAVDGQKSLRSSPRDCSAWKSSRTST